MNNETQRLMEALMLIYGSDLQAATITVLLKDGETGFRFVSQTLPQQEIDKCKPLTDAQINVVWDGLIESADYSRAMIVRAIEAAHGIKENT